MFRFRAAIVASFNASCSEETWSEGKVFAIKPAIGDIGHFGNQDFALVDAESRILNKGADLLDSGEQRPRGANERRVRGSPAVAHGPPPEGADPLGPGSERETVSL